MLRMTVTNGTQSIKEICECCGEDVATLKSEDLLVLHNGDRRVFKATSSEGIITVPSKSQKIDQVKKERYDAGMLTGSGAETESPLYLVRGEKMCSSSNGADTEFCYRIVENASTASFTKVTSLFKEKLSSSYIPADLDTRSGSKLGMDRKGEPVRVKSESYVSASVTYYNYFGAWEKTWWREFEKEHGEDAIHVELEDLRISKSEGKIDADWEISDFEYSESFALDTKTTESLFSQNYSANFDGTNDSIHLGEAEHLLVDPADIYAKGLTVSAWIYYDSSVSETGQPILSVGRSHNKYYGWNVMVNASKYPQFNLYGQAGEGGSFGQSASHRKTKRGQNIVTHGKWYHFTWVVTSSNNDNWKVYENGEDVTGASGGSDDVILTYDNECNMGRLGKTNTSAESWFGGQMSNVAVWNKALDAEQCLILYNDGKPLNLLSASLAYDAAATSSLLFWIPFSEGEGESTEDKTGRIEGGDITFVNGTTWDDTTPWT